MTARYAGARTDEFGQMISRDIGGYDFSGTPVRMENLQGQYRTVEQLPWDKQGVMALRELWTTARDYSQFDLLSRYLQRKGVPESTLCTVYKCRGSYRIDTATKQYMYHCGKIYEKSAGTTC